MSFDIDPNRPLDSLRRQGCAVIRTETPDATRFRVGGVDVSAVRDYHVTYEIELPEPLTVEATFSPESLGKKFRKILHRELQTGDDIFDPAVFITTTDTTRASVFLDDEFVRDAILEVVSAGGAVALSGSVATFAFVEPPDGPMLASMARVLTAAT